jgi:hypothetical protein
MEDRHRMSNQGTTAPDRLEPAPVSSDDPRVLQILIAEHSSLTSARSLAYNEAFTRADMFLGFLSMSLVGLALVAQVIPLGAQLMLVAAAILTFDMVVGLTTFGRVIAAGYEDYRAVHGMARIRHGYAQIASDVRPYFTNGINDDLKGVMEAYGSPPTRGASAIFYNLTTSAGMLILILAMVAGVLGFIVTTLLGYEVAVAFAVAVISGLGLIAILAYTTYRYYMGKQASIPVLFPTPVDTPAA